ncbi:hypothetical protein F3Y22_tig00000778pilonHSYRG00151 [Hibiscus syriacus]|uniref:protein-serine/threonine phosphatase n=1 Tax=Hibiscus syriacus TaxID=106335 RepID=A0A6A3D4E0_HIBSY|nr:hypothetical protein F3Y22_tig00000778pilonHSYRG00151 [Hibiscus syriacus]
MMREHNDGGEAAEHCRFHSHSLYVEPSHHRHPRLRLQTMALFIALAPSSCFEMYISTMNIRYFGGETLKRPFGTEHLVQQQKHGGPEKQSQNLRFGAENDRPQEPGPNITSDQRSCLSLEVVSGPSCGLHCSVLSTSTVRQPFILGRVPPSNLLLKDLEVSGKHARINWNSNKLRWELLDMGSLNGTLLNSRPINHPGSGSRQWGNPVELSSGDKITVGGKKFPMEDVAIINGLFPELIRFSSFDFGVFGICDGHGGVEAAKSASKILPEMVAAIISDSVKRERVVSQHDCSYVLREAFSQTEARMDNYYEGCTATLLLVWADAADDFLFAQCANDAWRQIVKQQDSRFSSEPYISQAVRINKTSRAFALVASDGLWDVISFKKAIQLAVQTRERYSTDKGNLAEKIADVLLNEARTLRTKDNTSLIFLDFNSTSTVPPCKVLP